MRSLEQTQQNPSHHHTRQVVTPNLGAYINYGIAKFNIRWKDDQSRDQSLIVWQMTCPGIQMKTWWSHIAGTRTPPSSLGVTPALYRRHLTTARSQLATLPQCPAPQQVGHHQGQIGLATRRWGAGLGYPSVTDHSSDLQRPKRPRRPNHHQLMFFLEISHQSHLKVFSRWRFCIRHFSKRAVFFERLGRSLKEKSMWNSTKV